MANTTGISAQFNNGAVSTMSSREIADIAEARHNDVVATIDRLFDKGLLRSSRKSRHEFDELARSYMALVVAPV